MLFYAQESTTWMTRNTTIAFHCIPARWFMCPVISTSLRMSSALRACARSLGSLMGYLVSKKLLAAVVWHRPRLYEHIEVITRSATSVRLTLYHPINLSLTDDILLQCSSVRLVDNILTFTTSSLPVFWLLRRLEISALFYLLVNYKMSFALSSQLEMWQLRCIASNNLERCAVALAAVGIVSRTAWCGSTVEFQWQYSQWHLSVFCSDSNRNKLFAGQTGIWTLDHAYR